VPMWAMDFTEYDLGRAGKIYLHNTQGLGSRHKFLPMAGGYPVGEEVAGYLSEKIDRYGAPLVLKRDNEGNMNHTAINDFFSSRSSSGLKAGRILADRGRPYRTSFVQVSWHK
jgi:hypothetical protein